MFGFCDHIFGALTVRIHRFIIYLKKLPDITQITSNLFVGGSSSIESLSNFGIQSILNLTETNDNQSKIQTHSINYFWLPTPDRNTPSFEDCMNATKWLKNQLANNSKIFIHCNLGRGRGPLMLIFYLISEGMKKDDAINLVKTKRSFVYLNKRQIEFLEKFHE